MAQQWRCHKSSECCRTVGTVTMTHAERLELEAASDVPMTWQAHAHPHFIQLVGNPACPLLTADGRCSVYSVRPYNCRRWGCFRPTTDEPLAMALTRDVEGDLKPVRLFTSKPVARQWRRMQAHAQPWALAHGWTETGDA